jgi:hypothetical protein
MRELIAKIGLEDRIESVKNYYSRLSEREQMIFLLSCCGGGLFVLILMYTLVAASNASLASDIKNNRKSMQSVADLGAKYRTLSQSIDDIERMIAQLPPNFQLGTELEGLASQNSIKIESIKDRPGSPHEFYVENQALVTLEQVQLRPLIDFLCAIENSGKPMRISTLQIKPNFKDSKLLNVNFIVSVFQQK